MMYHKLIFIFLLCSQCLFSQNKDSKKVTKELLQGKWTSAESGTALKYEVRQNNFFIMQGDSVLFECNDFRLTNKTLFTNCPGKENLTFKIKSVSDSTLYMKSSGSDYYHKYVKLTGK